MQKSDDTRWVIAGLGNPGDQYRRSRHNAGFMVAARIAASHGIDLTRKKFNGLYGEVRDSSLNAIIVMPQTFYNRSGECVAGMLGYFKVPLERLIVVHDEMDLPIGQLRLKQGGGDAGNRGVRSIAQTLGPDFIRVRVGIGHPEGPEGDIDHVIRPLSASELMAFEPVLDRAAEAVVAITRDGLERARNQFNQRR
ncbi:MAG TPA: aminoacyl-tRNA hydrolase [Candidatus Binataceae bacterium]|nr:aminoacyl-tRNA hydrolase [Candidatus Binataceae bacterium]